MSQIVRFSAMMKPSPSSAQLSSINNSLHTVLGSRERGLASLIRHTLERQGEACVAQDS